MNAARHSPEPIRVTDLMDTYMANAADAINAWGVSIDSESSVAIIEAAYMQSCATLHAAERMAVVSERAAAWIRDGLESVAAAIDRHTKATSRAADEQAAAIDRSSDAVAALSCAVAKNLACATDRVAETTDSVARAIAEIPGALGLLGDALSSSIEWLGDQGPSGDSPDEEPQPA